jgi:diguanylate cyclase (GGDEF)-like protein
LEEAARAEDVPARIGGDEFAVALPHTGVDGAVEMASRVARLFAEATVEISVSVTLSFGICGSDTTPWRSMMAGADLALYRSKDLGRNRIEVWVGAVPDDPPTPRTKAVGAGA